MVNLKIKIVVSNRRLKYESRNGKGRIYFGNAKETIVTYSRSLDKRDPK